MCRELFKSICMASSKELRVTYTVDAAGCCAACAKEAQCYDTGDSSTGTLYDGSSISNTGSQLPAGMTISPSCCLNTELFNDDDTALDYTDICNDASRVGTSLWVAISIAIISAICVQIV